jgi:hypothetical protein
VLAIEIHEAFLRTDPEGRVEVVTPEPATVRVEVSRCTGARTR